MDDFEDYEQYEDNVSKNTALLNCSQRELFFLVLELKKENEQLKNSLNEFSKTSASIDPFGSMKHFQLRYDLAKKEKASEK